MKFTPEAKRGRIVDCPGIETEAVGSGRAGTRHLLTKEV